MLGEEVELTQNVFIVVKLRVARKKEFEGDFESFRFHYRREVSKALSSIGEVKTVTVLT